MKAANRAKPTEVGTIVRCKSYAQCLELEAKRWRLKKFQNKKREVKKIVKGEEIPVDRIGKQRSLITSRECQKKWPKKNL